MKIDIHFAPGTGNHRTLRKGKQPKHSRTTQLPRVARLMALSIKYEDLLTEGQVQSHSELAELAGVERSHISTITRLRLLAPDIQEWLLSLPECHGGKDPVGFMQLRSIASIPSWEKQCEALHALIPALYPFSAPEAKPPKAHNTKNKTKENNNAKEPARHP